MQADQADHVVLGRCRIDRRAQQLWRDGQPVEMRPRAWSLLLALLDRPGELVTTTELTASLWPGASVTRKALTNRVADLRQALGDLDDPPRIIQTVPRRGYRLAATPAALPRRAPQAGPAAQRPVVQPGDAGRTQALAALDAALARSLAGQRQGVLVGGEPGIGKSWLLDRFATFLPAAGARVGHGQCFGPSSERESFGPWLALLAGLCVGPDAEAVAPLLRRCAPSWLLQLPWLQLPGEAAALRTDLAGAGTGRMLREGCALFEALARQRALVLLLDDLHWADPASVDLLQVLLQGREPLRLLVVAGWRAADAQLMAHPLAALAQSAGDGVLHRLMLQPLDAAASAALLQAHWTGAAHARRLLPLVQRAAQGNPLVLLATAQHLQADPARSLDWTAADVSADPAEPDVPVPGEAAVVPGPLRQVVAARLAALGDAECRLLQAASVVGPRFTPQLVAAALQADGAVLLQACRALATRQLFIRPDPRPDLPDRHAFVHDAYRQALYDTLPLDLRQTLHGRVARHLEQAVGADWQPAAATLAAAYVRAALPVDAARMLERTAEVSLGRFDHRAAVQALGAALQQLDLVQPPDAALRHTQVRLHLLRGNLLQMLRMGHPDAVPAYEAALRLATAVGDDRSRVRSLLGLCLTQALQGRLRTAIDVAGQLVPLAESAQPGLAAAAHTYAGLAMLGHGRHAMAIAHFERALSLPFDPDVPVFVDLPALARLNLGRSRIELGEHGAGLRDVAAGLARSRQRAMRLDLLQTLYWAADAHAVAGQDAVARALFSETHGVAERAAVEGYRLAAAFGQLATDAGVPGRSIAMAALLQRRRLLGECWNAAGFERVLARVCLDEGDLDGCRQAVQRGLGWQGDEGGTRHQAALLALGRAAGLGAADLALPPVGTPAWPDA